MCVTPRWVRFASSHLHTKVSFMKNAQKQILPTTFVILANWIPMNFMAHVHHIAQKKMVSVISMSKHFQK